MGERAGALPKISQICGRACGLEGTVSPRTLSLWSRSTPRSSVLICSGKWRALINKKYHQKLRQLHCGDCLFNRLDTSLSQQPKTEEQQRQRSSEELEEEEQCRKKMLDTLQDEMLGETTADYSTGRPGTVLKLYMSIIRRHQTLGTWNRLASWMAVAKAEE